MTIAARPSEFDQSTDEYIVLSNSERWVLREMLCHGLTVEKRLYFVHKCEKNSIPMEDAKALAEVFDLDIPDDAWDNYRPAV